MEYTTLHQLARQLNKPERQIRYRFRELVKEGKLIQDEDFRKEDFTDEFHFAYKINPLRFMEESKLLVDPPLANKPGTESKPLASNIATEEKQFGSNTYIKDEPSATNDPKPANNLDNQMEDSDTKEPNVATKDVRDDYIETLKGQLHVKDAQIEDYKHELAGQTDMSRRAVSEILRMKDEILRLRRGETAQGEGRNSDQEEFKVGEQEEAEPGEVNTEDEEAQRDPIP